MLNDLNAFKADLYDYIKMCIYQICYSLNSHTSNKKTAVFRLKFSLSWTYSQKSFLILLYVINIKMNSISFFVGKVTVKNCLKKFILQKTFFLLSYD